jgi:choline dehydrogenase-like flavoprotein
MARRLPRKDVVIVGLGWTGSILANELTDEGLDVIAIERGPWRDTATEFPPNYAQGELRYRIRHELFLRPDQTTFTFRNKMSNDLRRSIVTAIICAAHIGSPPDRISRGTAAEPYRGRQAPARHRTRQSALVRF